MITEAEIYRNKPKRCIKCGSTDLKFVDTEINGQGIEYPIYECQNCHDLWA